MKNLFILILLFSITFLTAQESIDGTTNFQNDPAKKYAVYVPSSYDTEFANPLMVGLHPLNTNRWNAESWRDTLIVFAETNGLILLCPDGGSDGAIDDPIDTAFTSFLIDSFSQVYNIDPNQQYLMGFSWGGKTVYSYGLRRSNQFAGFMPIGAAISGAGELTGLVDNAIGKNWFLVHGSNDSPNTRFHPAVEALEDANACLESNLISGVAHTIDFPNRNEILTDAFEFLQNNACGVSSLSEGEKPNWKIYPNPSHGIIHLPNLNFTDEDVQVYNQFGRKMDYTIQGNILNIKSYSVGLLFIELNKNGESKTFRVLHL